MPKPGAETSPLHCFLCRKPLVSGGAMYRVNQKGAPGVFVCEPCLPQTDFEVDPVTKRMVKAIQGVAP